MRAAWEAYDEYCRESHIVTDFIRFHPLLGNHCHLESFEPEAVRPIRNYVWVDLEQSPEELWTRSYSSKNRQNIRRALNHGVHVRQAATGEDYRAFVALYLSTMSRLSAGSYYFFSEPYFAALERLVADHGKILLACIDNEIVAACVFLKYGRYAHYHLGANSERGRGTAAANLLMHQGILWAHENEATKMHLGGGTTGAANDTLLRFKAGYSSRTVPFYVGRRIHDESTYHWLVTEWDRQHAELADSYHHILQRYRLRP